MKKPELLAPAGNMESLKAAISAGCDAVYLSGTKFGARAFAANFNDEELKEAINFAHLYGVKVYITVNTLIYDEEVNDFLDYIEYIHSINVDAVIMQDLGMMDLVRKVFPNLEIHASTQAHIHNLEGTVLMEELGIKRVVLARETPIELIKEIKEKTNIEIEIFVHGALCISYSGQCLMSSLIGGRSGNRGTCAQCCRQPYDLIVNDKKVNKNKYLLSTKDLNTLNYIGELIDKGIDSLKIEGRMKRPEYVYTVVSLYRKAIDSYIETGKIDVKEEEINDLKKIFNRDFTKGFIFNEDNDNIINSYRPNHMGIEIGKIIDCKKNKMKIKLTDDLNTQDGIRIVKDDIGFIVTTMYKDNKKIRSAKKGDTIVIDIDKKVSKNSIVLKTTDSKQLKEIQEKILDIPKIPIDIKVIIRKNSNMRIEITDDLNTIIYEDQSIIEEALKKATTKDEVEKQISKLGNTIYKLKYISVEMDEDVFVPVKFLNELRRCGIENLNKSRLYENIVIKCDYSIEVPNFKRQQKKSLLISKKQDYQKYDEVYVDNLDLYNKLEKVTLKLDRVIEHHDNYNKRLLVGEIGSVHKYKEVVTDFSLNVVNSYTVAFLHSLGVKKVTLSYELNDEQIERLINDYHERYKKHPNLELIIEGYEEVMVSKYKLIDNSYLRDRFNNLYKIKIKNNLMHIYNYKKRNLKGKYYEMGINWLRINKDEK